nr:ubiquitin hydrolase [Tanacetum cinerariifolium]
MARTLVLVNVDSKISMLDSVDHFRSICVKNGGESVLKVVKTDWKGSFIYRKKLNTSNGTGFVNPIEPIKYRNICTNTLTGVNDQEHVNVQGDGGDDVNEGDGDAAEANQTEQGEHVVDVRGIDVVADDEVQVIVVDKPQRVRKKRKDADCWELNVQGLSHVEGRLVEQKERELKYLKKIRTLEYYNESYKECIETLKKKLETLQQEKEGVNGKLAGLLTASKDLDNLIESQRSNKNKEGLGYSVVPPSIAQIYSSPKKDLSWTGLPEFADDTVTDYSRPSPIIESSPDDAQNKNPSTETGASDSTILSKPAIKFVKAANKATERPTTDKVKTAKKPAVKYAELYRKPSKKPTVRGNQQNWNNLKSQQLGENCVRKNSACFNCGHFDHMSYNCGLGVKIGRSSPKNNYTHRSMPPRPAIHRPYRPPMRSVRPNIYDAQPKRTSFYKPAHSYNKRPFQETTQDLVAILIQRVQRLERELKARTPIHKVNRGRSRPVMAWVPKK